MKHVEGFVFIPYGGQYRFALKTPSEHRTTIVCESNPTYDYYFADCHRVAPTLKELKDWFPDTVLLRSHIAKALAAQMPLPVMNLVKSEHEINLGLTPQETVRFEFVLIKECYE